MPRNKAKNPTYSSRSATRAGNICWEAQKSSKISRMLATVPSHQVLLTSLAAAADPAGHAVSVVGTVGVVPARIAA